MCGRFWSVWKFFWSRRDHLFRRSSLATFVNSTNSQSHWYRYWFLFQQLARSVDGVVVAIVCHWMNAKSMEKSIIRIKRSNVFGKKLERKLNAHTLEKKCPKQRVNKKYEKRFANVKYLLMCQGKYMCHCTMEMKHYWMEWIRMKKQLL